MPRLLLFAFLSWINPLCYAGLITQEQALDFGTFAANFNSGSSLQVGYNGDVMTSGVLHVIDAPQAARFRLTGYPINHVLTITINNFSLSRGSGDTFLITNFVHNAITTDGTGSALLFVGATLQVDAGNNYPDTDYSGDITVQVDD